jgi:NAD(P)-dependent dehydrogenase (short-subunit alcohol dehydrogenase family)
MEAAMKDRVAVITGATGGLGSVVAKRLAEAGARLVLTGTNAERLERLAGELALPSDRVLLGVYNFVEPEAAGQAAKAALDKFGRVDALLHLVGGWIGGTPTVDVPPGDLANMLDQHVWTTFYLAQAFVGPLVANKWGRIIVVSSPHASNPPANMGPYVVGKAAEEALVLTVAKEVARTGVTANVLQVRTIDAKHERDREPTPKNANWTTPEEIAAAIMYLCSDDAHVINGARIPLYGS